MAEQFSNLVELCERSCAKYASRPLYGTKRAGRWEWTTYGEFSGLVDRCRAGLASLGIGPGDRVGIVSSNRLEFAVAAYAAHGLEAAFVPMYPAQAPPEWEFILADAGVKLVFAGSDAIFGALEEMRPRLPLLAHVVALDGTEVEEGATTWNDLLEAGARAPLASRSPAPSTVANFIYTSGTTGKPKGVLLTHGNIASNVSAVHEVFTFEPEDLALSFLPWAHAYGQIGEVYGLPSMGAAIAINDDPTKLLENLAEVKPTILFAVPRIFTRIYSGVNQQIAKRPALLRRMIQTGIRGAIKRAHDEPLTTMERIELAFDEKVVFSKIRERFGGRLKYAVSASATLGHEIAEFIDALGITVYEGYGLTETSPIVSLNFPGRRRMGSVGRVIPGVRVEIDTSAAARPGEGEIVVYGPNVMVGYHDRPEENARAFTADGGLRTGDLGTVDEEGYLYITGRLKEQYKLENGKYVMPSPLEEQLKLSPYVTNVMIHGDGRPFNVALVVIDEAAIRAWAASHEIELRDDPTQNERVRALIRDELERLGAGFRAFERPKAFALVRDDFTVENGLLTPTLKLRRRDVLKRYGALLDALYAEAPREVAAPAPPA